MTNKHLPNVQDYRKEDFHWDDASTNILRNVISHLTPPVDHHRRTISDCVPRLIPTQHPELKVMVHLYSKNGMRYVLPEVWAMIRNVGIVRAPVELEEGIIRRLIASGVEVE